MQKNVSKLIQQIRKHLLSEKEIFLPKNLNIPYNKSISIIYITLFQEGNKSIRWGSKRENLPQTIKRIIYKLKTNPYFNTFNVEDINKCQILFEIVIKEYPCNIKNLTTMKMNSSNRF